MPADALADRSVPDREWPMPSAEVRRLLEPVPHWAPAPSGADDEPDGDG